jgi:hypothetical protein
MNLILSNTSAVHRTRTHLSETSHITESYQEPTTWSISKSSAICTPCRAYFARQQRSKQRVTPPAASVSKLTNATQQVRLKAACTCLARLYPHPSELLAKPLSCK